MGRSRLTALRFCLHSFINPHTFRIDLEPGHFSLLTAPLFRLPSHTPVFLWEPPAALPAFPLNCSSFCSPPTSWVIMFKSKGHHVTPLLSLPVASHLTTPPQPLLRVCSLISSTLSPFLSLVTLVLLTVLLQQGWRAPTSGPLHSHMPLHT